MFQCCAPTGRNIVSNSGCRGDIAELGKTCGKFASALIVEQVKAFDYIGSGVICIMGFPTLLLKWFGALCKSARGEAFHNCLQLMEQPEPQIWLLFQLPCMPFASECLVREIQPLQGIPESLCWKERDKDPLQFSMS